MLTCDQLEQLLAQLLASHADSLAEACLDDVLHQG